MTTTDRTSTWAIALTGAFILALCVADLAATKVITIGSLVAPGGIFLFSVIFVVRDMLHKLLGAAYTRRVIWVGVSLNLVMAAYFWWLTKFDAPAFFTLAEPWDAIFALAPGIVLGSIVAATASQLVNTAVYQWLWDREQGQAIRVIGSNAVSLPIDTVLFTTLAFFVLPPVFGAAGLPLDAVITRIASGQIVWKAGIMLAMTPLIYLIPENPVARDAT